MAGLGAGDELERLRKFYTPEGGKTTLAAVRQRAGGSDFGEVAGAEAKPGAMATALSGHAPTQSMPTPSRGHGTQSINAALTLNYLK
jgi:hypothetical protein